MAKEGAICIKEDLESMRCGRWNQDKGEEVYFIPHCHEVSAVFCSYLNGLLKLECPICRHKVVIIKVADE